MVVIQKESGEMKQVEQFSAKIVTLREILADPNYYAIPDMQRDYQWDIENGGLHGRKLWDNIVEFVDEDPERNDSYYMGTMITYKQGNKWMVIDGQQRLTTLSLLFIAARDIFDQMAKKGLKGEFQFFRETYRIEDLGRTLARQTVGTKNKPKLRPKASSKNNFKAFMSYLVPLGTRGEFSTGRRFRFKVVQAYEMFQREIANQFDISTVDGIKQLLNFLEHILEGLAINVTEVKDLAQGYRIFSSENTTGLKLGNLDIVRALILAQVDRKKMSKEDLDDIRHQLGMMMMALEPLSKKEKSDFIRHYWIMEYGTPMSKNKLTNSVANDVQKLTDAMIALKFCRKLSIAARTYAKNVVHSDPTQKFYIPHRNLIQCGFKQYRPLLLALTQRKDVSSQEYETIFLIIETLYVRFLLVGRQKGSLLEPVIAMWAKEATNKEKSITALIQKWISDARKIEEKGNFLVSFQMLKTTSKKKALYILTKIEAYKDPDVNEKHLLDAKVETVLPHTKDPADWVDTWPVFDARKHASKLQDSIGNYVLMNVASGLGIEANWETKREFYINQAIYSTTRNIAENNDQWNETSINQTSSNRAKIAENIWNLDSIKTA